MCVCCPSAIPIVRRRAHGPRRAVTSVAPRRALVRLSLQSCSCSPCERRVVKPSKPSRTATVSSCAQLHCSVARPHCDRQRTHPEGRGRHADTRARQFCELVRANAKTLECGIRQGMPEWRSRRERRLVYADRRRWVGRGLSTNMHCSACLLWKVAVHGARALWASRRWSYLSSGRLVLSVMRVCWWVGGCGVSSMSNNAQALDLECGV
jgi:hypothetical protein